MLVSALMVLGFSSNAQAQAVPMQPSAAALLDWAEQAHPQLFPDTARSQVHQDFLYRHYPATGNFVGVAGDGAWLLGPVAGPSTAPVRAGGRSDFACLVYPANCSTASDFPSRPLTLVVPFAAGGPSDRLARDLDAGFAAPYIASGQLKAIVQTGLIRSSQAALAGVPTLHDSGHPGFNLTSWAVLLAPKGTPAVVMERLDAAVRAVTEDPAFRQRQQAFSQEPIDDARAGAVGAARFMQAETGRLGEALRALGRYVE